MFKFNQRSTYMYLFICIFICTNATRIEGAQSPFSFNEEAVEGIEVEGIEDVDLDIYLDVGVHNELWQNVIEDLNLDDETELATYLEDNKSVGKMCRKLSRYIGKKIQKILVKYSDLESIKTVDELAYAMAHFKLDLNRYVKTGRIESNFKILDKFTKLKHEEFGKHFKERAIYYYYNKHIKPDIQSKLCDAYNVDRKKNEEAGVKVAPEILFATFAISTGTVLMYVPFKPIYVLGSTLVACGGATLYYYTEEVGSDEYRDRYGTKKPEQK